MSRPWSLFGRCPVVRSARSDHSQNFDESLDLSFPLARFLERQFLTAGRSELLPKRGTGRPASRGSQKTLHCVMHTRLRSCEVLIVSEQDEEDFLRVTSS
jgi:hypothetical protein